MVGGFIVPYETQSTRGRVWVAWWSKLPRPPLALRIQNFGRPDTITQHAFGRNADGDLIHYWWWAQEGWQAENLTQQASSGSAYRIAGEPTVLNLQSGDTLTQRALRISPRDSRVTAWQGLMGFNQFQLGRYAQAEQALRASTTSIRTRSAGETCRSR